MAYTSEALFARRPTCGERILLRLKGPGGTLELKGADSLLDHNASSAAWSSTPSLRPRSIRLETRFSVGSTGVGVHSVIG